MRSAAAIRGEAMADDTDRAIGRLEGRMQGIEDRIGDVAKNILERLTLHDQNSREGIAALRQDVVHANTEIRNRMEDGFGDMNERLEAHSTDIATINRALAESDGAEKKQSRIVDLALKAAPYLIGAGGLSALLTAIMK